MDHVQRTAGAAGMAVGDLLRLRAGTRRSVLPGPRLVTPGAARGMFPAVARRRLAGGVLGWDGQLVDDARLVVGVARTAAGLGARVLTPVRATRVGAREVEAVDELTGESLLLRGRAVVNATGVWAGTLDAGVRMRPSRGTHVVFDAALFGRPRAALTVPRPGSISRYVFALPQDLYRVIVGLTDVDAPGPVPDTPQPTEEEIATLLEVVNRVLEVPVRRSDVIGSFAGLRPLVDADDAATAGLSRRHLVQTTGGGFVNVLGRKLTTYRRMAEDAVDLACRVGGIDAPASPTRTLPLVGASPSPLPDPSVPTSLHPRHGGGSGTVIAASRDAAPLAAIAEGVGVTRAEVEFAVSHEGALDAADVLDRRTRIGLVDRDRAAAEAPVTELVDAALAGLG